MIRLSLVFFSQVFCGRELGGVTCKLWIGVPLFPSCTFCCVDKNWVGGLELKSLSFFSPANFVVKGVVSY